MGIYLHLFENEPQYQQKRDNDYEEPWVSYIDDIERVDFNKTDDEKLNEIPLTFEVISGGSFFVQAYNQASMYGSAFFPRLFEYKKNNGEWIQLPTAYEDVIVTAFTVSDISGTFVLDEFVLAEGDNFISEIKFKNGNNIISVYKNGLRYPTEELGVGAYVYDGEGDGHEITSNQTMSLDITVSPGDKVQFRGNNPWYMGCSYDSHFGNYLYAPTYFVKGGPQPYETPDIVVNIKGNIMSLVNSQNFSGLTTIEDWYSEGMMCAAFENMFSEYDNYDTCVKVADASKLILPATTLAPYCYGGMFNSCTGMTGAPKLPALTLTEGCYTQMFNGCTNLNQITCLATNISATDCVYDWVNGVSASGTFIKNPSMSSWPSGDSGIPTGWTVQDA